MRKIVRGLGGTLIGYLLVGGMAPQTVRAAKPAQAVAAPPSRALLDQYCVTCHNERRKTAGLMLDQMDISHVGAGAEVWEKVILKLRGGVMPPPGLPRPVAAAAAAFVASLEGALDRDAAAVPNPGRPAIHRLNRIEYTNAIRDLLALDVDGKALLPADDSGYGFDNIADVLRVSPGLLERYLLAAKKIARTAMGDPTIRPVVATYPLPYLTLMQDERMSEELPFGSRGGVAIRHYFPVDGEYEISIRVQRNSLNIGAEIRGLEVVNQIDVRLDGARVKLFTLGGRKYAGISYTAEEDTADSVLKVRAPVKAGMRVVGVTFVDQHGFYVEGVGMSRLPSASDGYASGRQTEQNYGKIEMGVEKVDIVGPFNSHAPDDTPALRRILVCRPTGVQDELPCAKTILSTLARRAYRRPVADDEVQGLLTFYKAGRADGPFSTGIQRALERVLTDPDFLFRVERTPKNAVKGSLYRISDLELASRLSFFLWSSIPDDALLDLASRGKLRDPAVLDQQVKRMIADPKAQALVTNFFGQWLYLRNLETVSRPDPRAFPEFDENLRDAFEQETALFLESQLHDDRPIPELLTANYTFLNERLARHYGIPGVYGIPFRRVTLPDDRRAGILGQGSLLTVTSYANRTSPVLRGKWLLENLIGTPPPAPPANVPPLKDDETAQAASMRVRMESHRKNPVCASCHSMLDPLGFALENFDGIGHWRNVDGSAPVDASGALPDGTKFADPATFRRALLSHREDFVRTLTVKLFTYALGRGAEYYDMPTVRKILHDSAATDYRWSTVIVNITKSLAFDMRKAES